MKESVIQLVRLKWLLGQTLTLLALWTVAALDLARGPIWIGVLALVLIVTLFPALPGKIPTTARRWLTPVLIILFLADLVFSGRDFIPPMVRLLLVLLAIRAVSVRRIREDLQLVLLAMFLSVVSGVFTLSMLFAVQAFLFALITIGLLFIANLLESTGEGSSTDGEWERFSWRPFIRDLRDSLNARVFRSMVLLVALLLLTTGILFISIPRVYLDQAIPFLRLPQAGMSGFSDVVRLGDVTSIQEDDSVAMRIDVPGIEAIPGDPYWRMLILDRYASGAFVNSLFLSPNGGRILPQVHSLSPFPLKWFAGENPSAGPWTFYLENGVSRYLPILGPFERMTFQGRQPLQANPEVLVFRIPEASNAVFSYRVDDFLVANKIPASALDQPLMNEGVPPSREENHYPYTTLGVNLEPEELDFMRGLVDQILDGTEEGADESARKILNYLQATHTYTLSPGSFGDGDPIVQWLKEERPGHCEFFAGAFTLLTRTAGIPARMVVGFNGGSWNSFEDYFVVRNRNAHAWSEILTDDSWVRFDPTPGGGSGASGAAGTLGGAQFSQDSDFKAWVDSLRVMWYRRVINFDDSSQQEMIEDLSGFARETGKQIQEFFVGLWDNFVEWGRYTFESAREFLWVVFGILALIAAGWIVYRRSALRWKEWGRKSLVHPIRRRAGIELRRLEDSATDAEDRREQKLHLREQLLEVRFGPLLDSSKAVRLFREARRFRRRRVG